MDTKVPPSIELTEKQREVLDRVLDHKSSKQIARELNISPHTVEQRIQAARRKFGASSRSTLALMYRSHKAIYDETVYESSDVVPRTLSEPIIAANEAIVEDYLIERKRSEPPSEKSAEIGKRLVPEVLDGPHGTVMRLSVILALATLFLVVGLAGLAMFSQLSSLLGP